VWSVIQAQTVDGNLLFRPLSGRCTPERRMIEQSIYDELMTAIDASRRQRDADLAAHARGITGVVIRAAGAEFRHAQRSMIAAELALVRLEHLP
jgi:hypothetical protein